MKLSYKDLIEMLKTQNPIVIFKDEIEFLETQFERNMLAKITSVELFGETLLIKFDEKPFINYNKSLERANWYNEKTSKNDLKFSELYERDVEFLTNYFETDEDLSVYFDIFTDEQAINIRKQYSNDNPECDYIKWLEKKISKAKKEGYDV